MKNNADNQNWFQTTPIKEKKLPSRSRNRLNESGINCLVKLIINERVGAISRVMVAFNKRGLLVSNLQYFSLADQKIATFVILFEASAEQVRYVSNDLRKLNDLIKLTVISNHQVTAEVRNEH